MRTDVDGPRVAGGTPAVLLLVLLSLSGIVSLLIMTRWGIGTSPDSVHYIQAARYLLGERAPGGPDSAAAALTHFAPLYSFLLAAGGLIGVDPFVGARWLNALLFGLNIFLVGSIVRRTSRNLRWLWVAGSLIMLGSLPVLSAHAVALTEPLFLLLGFLGFLLLGMYLERGQVRFVVGAAILIGLSFLARYAGAAYIITGFAAVLLLGSESIGRRIRSAFLFGSLAVLPMLAWMLRNLSVASTATGRELAFHPIGKAHIWQALYTTSSWVLIPPSAPDVVRMALGLGLLVVAAAILLRGRFLVVAMPPVIRVLVMFVIIYAAFLAVSISFLDANTPLDDRILLPVFAAALIVALYLLDGIWPLVQRRPAIALAIATLCVAFVGAHLAKGINGVATGYASGWGFTSLAWQQSATVAAVRQLPEGTPIYSNAPEIIYLHTGRSVDPIPRRWLLMNQQPNRAYPTQLTALKRELEADCGMVVYFHNLAGQKSIASEQELSARLALRPRVTARDGSILSATACQ